MKILTNLDLNKNQMLNMVLQVLAVAPSNPKMGQMYYNSTDKMVQAYDGTQWLDVGKIYILPAATSSTLGGIKVGAGLSITNDGVLSTDIQEINWEDIIGTPTTLNGYGITDAYISNGVIHLNSDTITPVVDANYINAKSWYTQEEKTKLSGIAAGAEVNVNADWNSTSGDSQIINKPNVISTLDSISNSDVLAASAGKALQDQIDNLSAIGRFLSMWDCTTGLPTTTPPQSPYTYHTGDYFIVSTVVEENEDGLNYKPSGTSYTTGVASTEVETQKVSPSDFYFYDGTVWQLAVNTEREIAVDEILSTTSTNPVENRVVTTALNTKIAAADAVKVVVGTVAIGATTGTVNKPASASSWIVANVDTYQNGERVLCDIDITANSVTATVAAAVQTNAIDIIVSYK